MTGSCRDGEGKRGGDDEDNRSHGYRCHSAYLLLWTLCPQKTTTRMGMLILILAAVPCLVESKQPPQTCQFPQSLAMIAITPAQARGCLRAWRELLVAVFQRSDKIA
jgi:hypothetical protein